jgi:hypothetical protein
MAPLLWFRDQLATACENWFLTARDALRPYSAFNVLARRFRDEAATIRSVCRRIPASGLKKPNEGTCRFPFIGAHGRPD